MSHRFCQGSNLWPFDHESNTVYPSGVPTMLFGCYIAFGSWHVKLLPSAYSAYTLQPGTSLQCYSSHIRRVHVCLSVTCHLYYFGRITRIFYMLLGTWGGMDAKIRVGTESWPWRRKLPATSAWTCDLSVAGTVPLSSTPAPSQWILPNKDMSNMFLPPVHHIVCLAKWFPSAWRTSYDLLFEMQLLHIPYGAVSWKVNISG